MRAWKAVRLVSVLVANTCALALTWAMPHLNWTLVAGWVMSMVAMTAAFAVVHHREAMVRRAALARRPVARMPMRRALVGGPVDDTITSWLVPTVRPARPAPVLVPSGRDTA